jgi:ribosomal protein L16/L10AE
MMLTSNSLQEAPQRETSEMVRLGLEASRVATEKMLDHYKRMGIKVTPQMTLAPEKPKRVRRKAGQ